MAKQRTPEQIAQYNLNRRIKRANRSLNQIKKDKETKRLATLKLPESYLLKKKEYDKKYWASERGRDIQRRNKHTRRAQQISTSDGTVTAQSLKDLREEQNYKCKYCDCDLEFTGDTSANLDHVIPLSKGGHHSITNVVWSCPTCNKRKSDRDLEEFNRIYNS